MSCAYGFTCESSSSAPDCCRLSGWRLIEHTLFYNVMWWVVYWIVLLITRQTEEWSCRLLTAFHGCTITFLSLTDILCSCDPFNFCMHPLPENQKYFLSFMLSYFLFDFLWIHIFGNESWVIYFHHASSILILVKILYSDSGNIGFSYGVFGLELTNPYLQLRWFLRTHGYLNTPIHRVVEFWFFGLFFVVRVLGGTVLLFYMMTQSQADIALKFCMMCTYVVTWILAWQIYKYIRKKYFSRSGGEAPTSSESIASLFPKTVNSPPRPEESGEPSNAPPPETEEPEEPEE